MTSVWVLMWTAALHRPPWQRWTLHRQPTLCLRSSTVVADCWEILYLNKKKINHVRPFPYTAIQFSKWPCTYTFVWRVFFCFFLLLKTCSPMAWMYVAPFKTGLPAFLLVRVCSSLPVRWFQQWIYNEQYDSFQNCVQNSNIPFEKFKELHEKVLWGTPSAC